MKNAKRTELIYNDHLFEKAENISFVMNHPERREISLSYDRLWEGMACTYHSVFFDPLGKLYYLYYRGMPVADGPYVTTCVATSTDGIHFERPDVGIYEIEGSLHNNVVFTNDTAICHNFAPFLDANPACPASERFKAVAGTSEGGLFAFVSADGFHWQKMQEDPVITDGAFDSLNTAFYDTEAGLYRCYSRYFDEGLFKGCRSIQSCTSEDFIHWSEQIPNRYNRRDFRQQLYTNSARPIPGAEHILVSTPMRFQPDRKKITDYPEVGISDCLLLFSRNGNDWDLPFIQPFIYPGLDERLWTQRNFIVSAGLLEVGNEMCFYVSEHYMWDDNRVTRYSLPRHRFASAYSEKGSFVTKPFTAKDDEISFNYMTSAYGSMKVSVLDESGKSFPCGVIELYGNELAEKVYFPGIKGHEVRLLVELEDAYLYAITF